MSYLPRTLVANKLPNSYRWLEGHEEIFCPAAVEPGSFFKCHVYLLDEEFIKAELIDSASDEVEESTDWIRVPSMYVSFKSTYSIYTFMTKGFSNF